MNRTALPWSTDRATRSVCMERDPPAAGDLHPRRLFVAHVSGLARSGNSTLVTGAVGLSPPSFKPKRPPEPPPLLHLAAALCVQRPVPRLRVGPQGAPPSRVQVGRPRRTVVASLQSPESVRVGREDPLGGRCQPDASPIRQRPLLFARSWSAILSLAGAAVPAIRCT